MEMKINSAGIIEIRKEKAWSQQHLADVSGLSLRTVQRIENTGTASQDSVKAIAMAFNLIPADLLQPEQRPDTEQTQGSWLTLLRSPPVMLASIGSTAAVLLLGGALLAAPDRGKSALPELASTEAIDSSQYQQITESALTWLAMIDEGKYAQSWEESDAFVKGQVTAAQWASSIKSARAIFGEIKAREVSTIQPTNELPGLADGEYVTLILSSHFTNKKHVVETVSMSKNSGEWRLIGYFIR